jgi:branched-chain amino acid transport system ATP-binding protein
MFLSVRDVYINYGKLEAVKGVTLEIPQGLVVSFLGANGAGKSTLFKTISGLKRPVSGSIWFEDKRIDTLAPDAILRAGIAQVPEGKRIFPYMTVMENFNLGAYSRKDGEAEISRSRQELLRRFPVLGQKAKSKAESLSGGQQQMLVIARALMAKPRLLLLDEPAQGLAPLVIDEIADIIRKLNAAGITIAMVEHNIRFVRSLAHKVFILENGRLVFEGDPNALSEDDLVQKIYLGGKYPDDEPGVASAKKP